MKGVEQDCGQGEGVWMEGCGGKGEEERVWVEEGSAGTWALWWKQVIYHAKLCKPVTSRLITRAFDMICDSEIHWNYTSIRGTLFC